MTFKEYEILMNGIKKRKEDEDLILHKLAFLNFAVQSTDKKGNPKYKTFDSFYKKNNKSDKFDRLKEYLRSKQNGRKL